MQNLKYLEKVLDEETRFGVILNETAMRHTEQIQLRMALSLLEFFNQNKFINENDVEKIGNIFYVSKDKYFKPKPPQKSKVFALRIVQKEDDIETNKKIDDLLLKIKKYKD